ncbi:MAG: hypothetical protein Q8O81_13830 [Giesbergeria sp.]|nr:hypothetical protein [Giesbergeria sp.]
MSKNKELNDRQTESDTPSADAPTITRNSFPRRPCPLTSLPFIDDVKVSPRRTQRKFWHVPKVDCYATANVIGAQYAADWIQYIKENPDMVGSGFMGTIVKEMYQAAHGDDKSHGIAVGFWVLIEKALFDSILDHYAVAETTAQRIKAYITQEAKS